MTSRQKKQVVIVGGGYAGTRLARKLSKSLDPNKHELTLVTARPFFTVLPPSIRMTITTEGNLEERNLLPYDQLFHNGNGTLVVARVVAVAAGKDGEPGSVILANGERVNYDILVLSPGTKWPGPLAYPDTKEDMINHIKTWREKFRQAKDVVLVGGGPVGIEYSGDLIDFLPHKKTVTIVHNQNLLLNANFPDRFRRAIERDSRAIGVNVILNESLEISDTSESNSVATRSGKKLNADLIVPTYGGKPATEFLKDMGPDVLTPTGHIRVTETLQLPLYSNIFAAGDAIDTSELKQILQASAHADVVATNIGYLIRGDQKRLQKYKGAFNALVVYVGKRRGTSYFDTLWGVILGNRFTSWFKLFLIGLTRKEFGY